MFRPHFFIGHAAGLDNHQTLLARKAAGVAEGVEDQTFSDQFQIGFKHLFPQAMQHKGDLAAATGSKARVIVYPE